MTVGLCARQPRPRMQCVAGHLHTRSCHASELGSGSAHKLLSEFGNFEISDFDPFANKNMLCEPTDPCPYPSLAGPDRSF